MSSFEQNDEHQERASPPAVLGCFPPQLVRQKQEILRQQSPHSILRLVARNGKTRPLLKAKMHNCTTPHRQILRLLAQPWPAGRIPATGVDRSDASGTIQASA